MVQSVTLYNIHINVINECMEILKCHSNCSSVCLLHFPQRALGEFPEKELQLQQMDVQGQEVLKRTSEEGRVHIIRDMQRLQESWLALYNMSLNLHRYSNTNARIIEAEQFSSPRGYDVLKLQLFFSVSSRLLNSSTEQPELSVGGADSQSRAGGSKIQRGQERSGREGSLGGDTGEGGEWIQAHAEEHEEEHLNMSRTDRDSERPPAGVEEDTSAWSAHNRAVQRVSTTDGSPHSDKSTGGDSSVLATARGHKPASTQVIYGDGGAVSSGEGSVEAGESLSQGGGAFVLFRRDPARQPATAPSQDTRV